MCRGLSLLYRNMLPITKHPQYSLQSDQQWKIQTNKTSKCPWKTTKEPSVKQEPEYLCPGVRLSLSVSLHVRNVGVLGNMHASIFVLLFCETNMLTSPHVRQLLSNPKCYKKHCPVLWSSSGFRAVIEIHEVARSWVISECHQFCNFQIM